MTPIEYLFIGLMTVLTLSGWTLWTACRRATDGYEDGMGFHLGFPPALSLRMEASLVGADALPAMPVVRRRRGNSRSPFRAASAAPFEPAVPIRRRPKRVDSTPPMDVSAQAVFNQILGQESAQ